MSGAVEQYCIAIVHHPCCRNYSNAAVDAQVVAVYHDPSAERLQRFQVLGSDAYLILDFYGNATLLAINEQVDFPAILPAGYGVTHLIFDFASSSLSFPDALFNLVTKSLVPLDRPSTQARLAAPTKAKKAGLYCQANPNIPYPLLFSTPYPQILFRFQRTRLKTREVSPLPHGNVPDMSPIFASFTRIASGQDVIVCVMAHPGQKSGSGNAARSLNALLDVYNFKAIIGGVWEVEFTDEFGCWWETLTEDEQESLAASVELLRHLGPSLPRPHSDTLKGSKHSNMKELRTQHEGRPIRTFYAFDPRRHAILLIGGDKSGDDRFYDRMLPLSDRLYDEHLKELRKEGLI